MIDQTTTIVATATATGGAISVIRLSGSKARPITESIFSGLLKDRVAVFGTIKDSDMRIVDEVIGVYYQSPRSYTGEDCVEISCHGSTWITSEIIRLLVENGAKMATAGEFTLRAFLNGKLDLSQAEAVADLIASNSHTSSSIAINQMRGGYSEELRMMSGELLHILSMLELELDFGEEDVEFADRTQLRTLIERISQRVEELSLSFRLGNVLKNGIPVAIIGKPNVGKSTLLNRLLGEERAIVSSVAGTTRDFIEETLTIDGIIFRFIDTAGLRTSDDEIERIGIERSYEKLSDSSIVLHLIDGLEQPEPLPLTEEQKLIVISNKVDKIGGINPYSDLAISAKVGIGIDTLKHKLVEAVGISDYDGTALVVSNSRHYSALTESHRSFQRALNAIECGLPTDLVSSEIRSSLASLGEITGEITTDDILANIFSKFCIGK